VPLSGSWRRIIGSGLRNPRKSLEYLLLGPQKFKLLYIFYSEYLLLGPQKFKLLYMTRELKDTCYGWKPTDTLEDHMTSMTDIHEHLITLWMLAVEHGFLRVLELGTRTGESTIALLLAAKRNGGHVTSIDMDACVAARQAVEKLNLSDYWTFMQHDDLQVGWNEPIDLLFVDTSHTYEQTLKELEKFEPHVLEGGIIVMHDIVHDPPVDQAIMNYIKERSGLRLYRYLNNNGLAIIFKGKSRVAPPEQPQPN
jgi:predicted O-methyltransferase YrrM